MQVAEQAEAGHVGERVRAGRRARQRAASRFSVVITRTASSSGASGDPALHRGRDGAGAERLGQHERVAGDAAGVRQHLVGMDDPGHREPELRLGVLDRVAAERSPRPPRPPPRRRPRRISSRTSSPSSSSENATRFSALTGVAAHRVDVGERVGGGDPSEVERVIDDRREEVDRLDEREIVAQPVDARVVGGVEADEDVRIRSRAGSRASSGPIAAAGSLQPQPAPWESEVSETTTHV